MKFKLIVVNVAVSSLLLSTYAVAATPNVLTATDPQSNSTSTLQKAKQSILTLMTGGNSCEHKDTSSLDDDKIAAIETEMCRLQEIVDAGGWKPVLADKLEKGNTGIDVAVLIERLAFEQRYNFEMCEERTCTQQREQAIFDSNVAHAVADFQRRHGLGADGVVGEKTLVALNVSAQERLNQLNLNISRIEEFEDKKSDEYVKVNIPDYTLKYVVNDEEVLTNKVVVGKPQWSTPSFSDEIEKFVVNPDWRIPLSIATKEIAPKVANNPEYLEENNIEIRKRSYVDDQIVDPNTIDWEEITPYDFDYFLVRKPGEDNPLGEVKYLFPNRNAIYVHDTPNQAWFNRKRRAASHGCIRMEDPFSLAQAFAKKRPNLDFENEVSKAKQSDEVTTFYLEKPIPIHLVYWTAWVDESGAAHYRQDIYKRDMQYAANL